MRATVGKGEGKIAHPGYLFRPARHLARRPPTGDPRAESLIGAWARMPWAAFGRLGYALPPCGTTGGGERGAGAVDEERRAVEFAKRLFAAEHGCRCEDVDAVLRDPRLALPTWGIAAALEER